MYKYVYIYVCTPKGNHYKHVCISDLGFEWI